MEINVDQINVIRLMQMQISVNVDQMQVFVIINNIGIMINVDANGQGQLIKAYVIKDIFGILVIVSVNAINHVMLVSIQIMKIVNVEKGRCINQQRNVMKILKDQVQLKLIRQSANIILAYYTLCCFQYSLQPTLVLILFTINT